MKCLLLSGLCLLSVATAAITIDPNGRCGLDSASHNASCPLNLCCSGAGYCGFTPLHCGSGCQPGFGGCKVVAPPACDPKQNSAASRTIGYYQATAATRQCNPVRPQDLDTDGLTHLNFAFAGIDNTSFHVVPMKATDVNLYQQFTALQDNGVETWIAIGGGDFNSQPSSPNFHTWSQMVSSEANRQAFISSVLTFLDTYNFQGVDLDWEFPGLASRGGQPSDVANYATLVQELSIALGEDYGLSVILPPDFLELIFFDVKSMEPYVNWFGFMSYDLHSYATDGGIIRTQSNITDIKIDATPLWFDQVDLGNVNFGLPYYGRGYTVSNRNCMSVGCNASGPSKSICSGDPGFMMRKEIADLIAAKHLTPKLIPNITVKQITFDDQWIGYDDDDTIAMKMQTASSLCFGGTMIWALDYCG